MKKLFTLFLALVATSALWAEDFEVDGIYYNILTDKTKEVEVTYCGSSYSSYDEYSGSVTIPETVTYNGTTYSVTSIGNYAFYRCTSLTSITIPNSVTSIGYMAFANCSSLTSVTIGNSVTTIGNSAFYQCTSLTSITIPNSVTTIGNSAFLYCSGLTSITLGNSVTSIGERAFEDCIYLGKTNYTGDVAGWCRIQFSSDASNPICYSNNLFFNDEELKNLVIPNTVDTIYNYAFYKCSGLTSITIPNSVTSIGYGAFRDCSGLTSPVYNAHCFAYMPTSYKGAYIIPEGIKQIAGGAFSDCESLTSITIPNSVTSIGEGAFIGCSGLTSPVYNAHCFAYMPTSYKGAYIIPEGIKQIAGAAFWGCSGLTSITIPNSVTSIEEGAFWGCSGLTSVTIGNNVTSIGDYAFLGCSDLTSVTIGNSVTSIGEYAFYDCYGLTSITIPNSVTTIGNDAFLGCESLTSVVWNAENCADFSSAPFYNISSQITSFTFGDSVQHIPAYLCYEMSSLTSLTIPNSVTSIGDEAFSGCSSLTSITIPNSVMSIGDEAFEDCSKLTLVTINSNAIVSKDYSYNSNISHIFGSQVTEYIIGDDAKGIGNEAFYDCSSLTSVTIGNSVTSIGDGAFSGCSSLTSITIPNSVTSIGRSAFIGCSSLTSLTIPNSVTSIGEYTFYDCSSLTSITIPNSVTSIGEDAFYSCSSLTKTNYTGDIAGWCNIDFSNGYANPIYYSHNFYINDQEIKDLVIPNSITSIGGYTFYGCSSLTSVTIGNSVTSIGSSAFEGCSGLTSITIPNSVTSIGKYAFYDCSGLTSITIGNSVTSIGEWAFSFCSSLTSITIPNSVTNIGSCAFYRCSSLTSITCEVTTPPTVGEHAFYDVSKSIPVYVPCGCVKAYKAASGWSDFTNIQEPLPEYSIEVYVNDTIMGSAKVDWNRACDTQISATPNFGYQFVQWNDGNTDNPRSFVLTQDTILIAEFAPNTYTITTVSSDTLRGTTQGDTTVNYLENVTISATANYGYHFSHWNDYNYDNPRKVQVTEDKTYTAYFDKNTYYITKKYDSNQGYINGSSSGEYLDNITLTAEANYGYHFVQWSDGSTENPRSLILTQDTTLTAEFAPNTYTITTVSSDTLRGTTQGDTTVNYLENVTISATANYGYHFSHWNDYNYNNPRQVQVTENKTYTAYFDKNTYYITKNYNSNQGYVNGSTSGKYLDNITLTAEPNCGYHFLQWSDGNTDNPRTFVITQDTTFSAEFAQSFSGQCGDNLYWSYNESDQTISITGSGKMYDYTASTQPWLLFQEQITEVTTSNTTSSIGTSAFEGCIRLGKVSLGYGMGNIAVNAFAECDRLYDIYCYATYPPFAKSSSFANYNVYLYIPCENQRDYILDVVWGNFKYIECIGAESDDTGGDDIVITPGSTDVTITWPTENNADTYTIVIKKDGEVVCTLTFNADGQLLNIAFAPGREGNHPAQYAEATVNGYRFTVTGLEDGTKYAYNLDVKDSNNQTIQSYSGEFATKSDASTSVSDIQYPMTNSQKLLRNGQLIIIRDGVEYNAMGQEL